MALQTIDLIAGPALAGGLLADAFRRPISYLRISVTDRCNLRCTYCMPEAGLPWIPNADVLTFDEIEHIARAAAGAGVRSIRLTGGEPLVRPNLVDLVRRLAAIDGIDDIALSTNGILLADAAGELAAAGLKRVNISLDTLRPDRFETIARRPGLDRVLAGIDAALAAGLTPVKINCVVMRGTNDDEILDFAALARDREIYVRFIEMMPVVENVAAQKERYVSAGDILARIGAAGTLEPVDGPGGNGPARYFAEPGARGTVGVISPLSHDYCDTCNRVRLTADGRLRLCLFGDYEIDLRTPTRAGASENDIAALLRGGMLIKPERHHLELGETSSRMRAFSEIGG
jgi:cyclic pyranopterin phosphate synthase